MMLLKLVPGIKSAENFFEHRWSRGMFAGSSGNFLIYFEIKLYLGKPTWIAYMLHFYTVLLLIDTYVPDINIGIFRQALL